MARIVGYIASSLDGFIATEDDSLDWLFAYDGLDLGEHDYRQFLKSIGQRKPVGVNYFCDAAVLAEGGIPSVVFGPGDIAQAHTPDEWISLRSLERATAMLVRFLSSQP